MSKISSKNIKRLSVPQSPVVLAILDGWGYRKEKSDNAIKSASTPIMDSLWHGYPPVSYTHLTLPTSPKV